jgi:ATP-binding cassette subfamily B protein
MSALTALAWPTERLPEGLELLARAARLPIATQHDSGSHSSVPPADCGRDDWMRAAGRTLGLEVEPVDTTSAEVRRMLSAAAPAVVAIHEDGETRYVMIAGRGRRTVRVLGADHHLVSVDIEVLRAAFMASHEQSANAEIARLVDEIGVPGDRQRLLVDALVTERLRGRRLGGCWLLRLPPGRSFRAQLRAAGIRRAVGLLATAHLAEYLLWVVAWWMLGRTALRGQLDAGWLLAWTLVLATLVPIHLAVRSLQGRLSIDVGARLKQRLLAGALRLDPEEIRREGAGQLLGRVIESQAVESLSLSGGLLALLAGLELIVAAAVLAATGAMLPLLLALWTSVTAALGWAYFRRRRAWTETRITMTHELVEQMVGHRTRLVQQPQERWHDGEDATLERYLQVAGAMDRAAVRLMALSPRGWMLVGMAGLLPAFVGGGSPVQLAVALGGILLAFRALRRFTAGLWNLTGAAIAWRQTASVFHAAARPVRAGALVTVSAATAAPAVLEADDVSFRHAARPDVLLKGCRLAIAEGDRVILQGPSGSGKSTLASLLAGLRQPDSGLVLFNGLDAHTLGGEAWRRRVVLVPQFHENHVLLGSLAFNLLMGVSWPSSEANFSRADEVCRELGLGDLLERMPAGLLQTVGETGWQLSHGERSRLFLARALLQQPKILILDESFAQLDPSSLQRALEAVLARPAAVLLIAHP